MSVPQRSWELARRTFREFGQDQATRHAAALSYYTIFALPPVLVLLLLILSAVLDPQEVQRLLQGQFASLLGPGGGEQIREILTHADRPDFSKGLAAFLGVGALLFGATGAFVELQAALNRMWDVKPDPRQGGWKNFVLKRAISFGMVLTIAFLLLVSLAVSAVLAAIGDTLGSFLPGGVSGVLLRVLNLAVSLAVVTALFALMFKYLPDARARWQDVFVGALATAVLFTLGKFLIGLYLGRSDPGSAFGAAGSLALLLVWVHYSALILFLGAEFTQVWADARGAGIEPEPGAVHILEERKIAGG